MKKIGTIFLLALAVAKLGFSQGCSVVCSPWETCNLGKCQDLCLTTKCAGGSTCQRGQCKDPECKCVNCKSWQFCQNGKCIDRCTVASCSGSCFRGVCDVVDKCLLVKCPFGQKCKNGKCVVIPAQVFCPPQKFLRLPCVERSTYQQCPGFVYKKAPNNGFCGVSYAGELRNYPELEQCLVCREEARDLNAWYYNVACQKLNVECKSNEKCISGNCRKKCVSGKCPSTLQCKDGYCI